MQLLPAAFFAVTLSGQHPYWVPAQPPKVQLLPVAFFAVTLSGQQPYWVAEHPPILIVESSPTMFPFGPLAKVPLGPEYTPILSPL